MRSMTPVSASADARRSMTQASTSANAGLQAAAAPRRRAGRGVRRFVRHRLALAGFATVVVLAFAAGAGPYLNPYDDLHIDILHRFAAPFAGSSRRMARRTGAGCRYADRHPAPVRRAI